MNGKIRALIVDDHNVVRKGLCSLLSAEKYGIDVIGEAADGKEAIEKARSLQPDIILLDLAMPGMGGLEAIPVLRVEVPSVRILVLTSSAEEHQVVEAITSGALGYLMKDASPDELVNTIHNVYLNHLTLPRELAYKVMLKSKGIESESSQRELTGREEDVLGCVARGLSNKQIASELGVSTTTVRTHISNLLRKLTLENRTQLALYAQQRKIT